MTAKPDFRYGRTLLANNSVIDPAMLTMAAQRSALYEAVLVDGGPENYKEWASHYESDVKALGYAGYKSVNEKWKSYHEALLSDDKLTTAKHRVFDAGCGSGLVGEDLITIVPPNLVEIYGGDLSLELIEIARSKNVYADLRVVNLKEELPYQPEYFDSVVCAGVFLQGHCGPDCLPNLIRVLKKGGYLIATVRKLFYEETKQEWQKQLQECNCKLLADTEMPYHDDAKAIVVVIIKL